MLFPFPEQQDQAHLQQIWADLDQMLQSEQPASLTLVGRDRLRQRHRLAPLAMGWRMAGNFPPMLSALEESRKATRNPFLESQVLWGPITALIASGRLRDARTYCQELEMLIDSMGGPLPVAAYPDLFQAQLAYTGNQLDLAGSAARRAIEKTAPLRYMDILICAYDVLVRVYLALGDLASLEQAVREMERVHQSAEIPLFRPWVEGLWSELWLAQGEVVRAREWAAHTP